MLAISSRLLLFLLPLAAPLAYLAEDKTPDPKALQKLYRDGNYKDAFDGFRIRLLDGSASGHAAATELKLATDCLSQLGRLDELDAFREQVIARHQQDWRLLWGAGRNYQLYAHYGFRVAGEYQRGRNRGGGERVSSNQRDRVRALQLFVVARKLAAADPDAPDGDRAQLALELASALRGGLTAHPAWKFQLLTDLTELPDLEPLYYGTPASLAPVDGDGAPVMYAVPESFEAANNDGERWRSALSEAAGLSDRGRSESIWNRAQFLQEQFGVHTLGSYFRPDPEEVEDEAQGPYALAGLGEDETLARLATGIHRFALADEFNHITLYRRLAEDANSSRVDDSLVALARLFQDRRQMAKAAALWKRLMEAERDPNTKKRYRTAYQQIVGNWGQFESTGTQPARRGAEFDFRFRNGNKVTFEAHLLEIDRLIEDITGYLKSRPGRVDRGRIDIDQVGYRLVKEGETRYLGRKVANWELDLTPADDHLDSMVTVATPLMGAGAYLLSAKMADGNETKMVLWLADTAIVKKSMQGKTWFYVADAVNGVPIEGAHVEFLGYRQQRTEGRNYVTHVKQLAGYTDQDGQLFLPEKEIDREHRWLAVARTDTGRLAYLGFLGMWYHNYQHSLTSDWKAFAITDRPVYRPGQTVEIKAWVGTPRYDHDGPSEMAGRSIPIEIRSPRNEAVLEQTVVCDEYGGFQLSLPLDDDAILGDYWLRVKKRAAVRFKVEEYKKPEFEVTIDAPDEAVTLGDKLTAKIEARYYFGTPVSEGTIQYKVLRTSARGDFYPPGPWDWLYGKGYGWFGMDHLWYPGFGEWGCRRPIPQWLRGGHEQPEVVAEGEARLGEDGTFELEIDTAAAKAAFGDRDHRYSITAEVTDASRRTITGQGAVHATRRPFRVTVWTDRGHYRTDDTITARASAHTIEGKPVQGAGELKLFRIRHDKGGRNAPEEELTYSSPVTFDAEGRIQHKLTASRSGQYRLSVTLTDDRERTVEGGIVFSVLGVGALGSEFRFNDLELIPDRAEYEPGDTVKLLINTDRPDSVVVLFLRPANNVYAEPEIIRLRGRSKLVEFEVGRADMPNFYVEALTLTDGRLHSEARMIAVPPEKRMLEVSVEPDQAEVRPGIETGVTVTVTGPDGRPFVGPLVMSIYDRAVEYISGGSNLTAIREAFWNWRRYHSPQQADSLLRNSQNLIPEGAEGMAAIGMFGQWLDPEAIERLQSLGYGGGGGAPGRAGGMKKSRSRFSGEMDFADGLAEAPAGAPASARFLSQDDKFGGRSQMEALGEEAGGGDLVEPTVRREFADTAYWNGALVTDSDGRARVDLTMPDNLTTWKVRCWSLGHGFRVGEGSSSMITTKNLLLRLQAPRFFTEKDEVVLSANVHNELETAKSVQVALELEGNSLVALDSQERMVEIDAHGEARIDFRVRVDREGEALIRMTARTDEESDAMEMRFPVFVHGMEKMDAVSGALRPDQDTRTVTFDVPQERRPEQSRLELRYSPTLAGAMVDALPYLVEYPYGCTEQTLNRFLPTVVTQNVLLRMGLDLDAIRDKRANLNAQEIGDPKLRAARWQRFDRNPVFDEETVRQMARDGLNRLTAMQLSDGGWGWFSGSGERSWPHTTATVVRGLLVARDNDIAMVRGTLENGIEWLKSYQGSELKKLRNAESKTRPYKTRAGNLDAYVYQVLVAAGQQAEDDMGAMAEFLYRDRLSLSLYSQALLGIAFHALDDDDSRERLAMILHNLSQFLEQDAENQTAWLRMPREGYWFWYRSEYEALATYLKLLARTDPKGEVAAGLAKYLVNNRKHATYWKSTRDTALAVEALAEFLEKSGEAHPDLTVEILVDGELKKTVSINSDNLFSFDDRLVLEGTALTGGDHTIEIRRTGIGPVYFNLYTSYFTLEDHITRAGLELRIDRSVYKLVPVEATQDVAGDRGQAVSNKVEKYRREKLSDLALLKSGDLVEVELEIASKNDYEYLIFEDLKPAGFEPVEINSGYTRNPMGAYMELRDRSVSFFVKRLNRGDHSIAYRLRAEIPGTFSALPAKAWAMYAPELKGNSEEIKVRIED